MIETFKGVIPFLLTVGIRVAFIILFPKLVLLIPHFFVSK